MADRLLQVALPLPFATPFTYRIPDGMPDVARGCRVAVPFGRRRAIGVALGPPDTPGDLTLKDVDHVIDEAPLVAPALLDLALWVADYYLAPPGECLRLVLPPAGIGASRSVARVVAAADGPARQPSAAGPDPLLVALGDGPLRVSTLARRLGGDPSARLARLRREGRVVVEQELESAGFRSVRVASLVGPAEPRGAAQAALLERLRRAGGRARVPELLRGRSSLRGALAGLVERGAVRLEQERQLREPAILEGGTNQSLSPSVDQSRALGPLLESVESRAFATFLLHGVTGSGKTEVYFKAAERALAAGRGVLILVPEIALTPLLVRAAAARFGRDVAVLHSELGAGERHDQWWRIREAEARLVIGARSAVFAPLPELGLLVVDEEHEAAYKQEESPRYHARDVAVMRGRLEGASVVLGSATPSLESHANALRGKYTRLSLSARIGPRGLPSVEVVDRREMLKAGSDPILAPALRAALGARLERAEQALLLLNRRGYATSLLCRECGLQAACPNCSVSLTLHRGGRVALCHYCGHEAPAPSRCGACRGEYLRLSGYGTEKVVEAVQAALPRARVARLDSDSAARRGEVARTLAAFRAGELDVLVGTQLIAKGHDFPRVTLVGVVDADVGLGLPDFRAAERTFQLLTQVAGRAGRAELPGEVILQSHLPDHYALRLACAQDYEGFFAREMEFRSTMGYPPALALLNLVLRSRDAGAAARTADALGHTLRAAAAGRYRVLGPARAPLARLRQEHRFQILLKGRRAPMRDAVRRALADRFGKVRWPGVAVDVDPVSVM
jgi:primosomal protein N' (replication factor Y)